MSPANRMVRLPPAAFIILSNIIHLATAYPYALPQPTKTVDYHQLNVLPWPVAATAAPGGLDDLLNRRAYNTVCGYIGGDPALPATCSAGSHCVIDVDAGAVGCCPDGGSCTQGVYTGCVDSNSGAQSEVNPYVYTCQGSDLCYKNSFEGGYSQYGCGSISGMATTVAVTASGKSSIDLSTLPVTATTTAESSESTARSTTKKSTSSRTRSSKSATETSTTETASTKTKTNTKTSSTESSTLSASETSSTASESTETDGSSPTESGDGSSSSTTTASAPDTDGDNNGSKNTGAIIGGTISGVAALVAFIFLGIWLWKRKKGKGAGLNQKPQPGSESSGNIQPLLPMQEVYENHPPPPRPVARGGTITPVTESDEDYRSDPYQSDYPYGYGAGSAAGGGMAAGNSSHQMDQDEVPLTRETRNSREIDDYSHGFGSGLGPIGEESSRPTTAPASSLDSPTSVYPGPRGGGGGPLWQQNRGPSWL
ncbi:hypothetical protein G7Z17_g7355 [Cylindrodendrum hubeiense]|uniref:Uncharacterized protein n=1 Tax=Cylindrodendrum hubeiense TaxID=595255 RepID=A0A9P5H793_9HYPO|nr:hypothetical protein G7Z17_g7355 [Cylindrodendrum hubeiense]